MTLNQATRSDISLNRSQAELRDLCATLLGLAKSFGATDAAASVSEQERRSVTVRNGQVDVVEHQQSARARITVYLGDRSASASSADLTASSLHELVERARDIARLTAPDPFAALPDDELLERSPLDLALCSPWPLSVEAATALAAEVEQAVLAAGDGLSCQGASVSTSISQFASLTSRGFEGGYARSSHGMSALAQATRDGLMQTSHSVTSNSNATRLRSAHSVGDTAARRTLAQLGARKLASCDAPVLFEARVAGEWMSHLIDAASGGAQYRQTSFLPDAMGQTVLATHLSLDEDPFVASGRASCPFDDDGVRVLPRDVVRDGVLQGYFLSTYSARRLGLVPTGHTGGAHNLFLRSSTTAPGDDLHAMCRKMGTGLLVTRTMGDGANGVTGDYSQAVGGFWVVNGEIQYPVDGITIAGNFKTLFLDIVGLGADVYDQRSLQTGSILVERMRIAGA